MRIPQIKINDINKIIQYKPDERNLLETIHQKLGRTIINSLCGGSGKCGKCRVELLASTQSQTNPPTKTERIF
ncbi:MAG: 2Fe-2S iron-sulfur cluster-binding protein [Candidatus Hodarchaeota archaeon]